MEFLSEYGLFLAKIATFVVAILVVAGSLYSLSHGHRKHGKGHIEVHKLNEQVKHMGQSLEDAMLPADELKALRKQQAKEEKAKAKKKDKKDGDETVKKRVFLLNFKGDIRASAVDQLREEITTVLSHATENDEVVVRLESAGGMVHSYGLAASQLDRIRKHGIPLTVCVDKVAASGGYMMACVADKILAAPFSLLGSIGVVAQLPNFHNLLKKHDVDYEVLTAGEYKRTLTVFGENTEQGREKFLDDLEQTHELFKAFVSQHRSEVDIDKIATGEVWLGSKALELNLVDDLQTSDEYLVSQMNDAEVLEISFVNKKSIQEKLGLAAESSVDRLLLRWLNRLRGPGFFS